jgi:hypothetical protein
LFCFFFFQSKLSHFVFFRFICFFLFSTWHKFQYP